MSTNTARIMTNARERVQRQKYHGSRLKTGFFWIIANDGEGGRRSLLAEREGFEPPIRLPVCRISSAVHSTTLPPLQTSNFNHLANPREEQNRKLAPDWHRACQLLFRHSFCRLRQCALHDLGGTIIGLHEVGVDVERDGR